MPEKRWLDDMLIVQERLGVLDCAILLLSNVVSLSNVVIPVDSFGKKTVRAIMMFGDSAKNH